MSKTTCTAEDVANSYINDIWRQSGLLMQITSDRALQSVWRLHKELNRELNIKQHLFTPYHPQTDGLSERVVQARK